jgi:hypothetical protein
MQKTLPCEIHLLNFRSLRYSDDDVINGFVEQTVVKSSELEWTEIRSLYSWAENKEIAKLA